MTTIGETTVTVTIENLAVLLTTAAELGIDAQSKGTVVSNTALGIAGTLIIDATERGELL